jgi:uncharacterized protein (DUF1800 family)
MKDCDMPNPQPDLVDDSGPAAEPLPSRRRFFALGAGAVAALASGKAADAQTKGGRPSPFPVATPAGTDASAAWQDPLLRLVRRVTMGMSPADIALARQLGYAGYLEYQLNADRIDDSTLESVIATRLPMTQMTLAQLLTADSTEAEHQLSDATWYRAAFAQAQLRERMVEFWTDHFNININTVGNLKLADDRDVIRPYALATFGDLVRASAHSGAMLRYLNQDTSRTPTPNQNYARELMELHTLGVDNGYTQNDVAELSRILTGWSATRDGTFTFVRSYHDRNAKTFLGRVFPAMASTSSDALMRGEGDTAIQMLLDHPGTAQYVSFKMARWLLSYTPPQAVVNAAAATFTRTNGDIKSVIRTILTSANLRAAPAKYKRPFHLAISSIRALGVTLANTPNIRNIRTRADQMGQAVFTWEQPDGFPDKVSWWSGLVIARWSYTQVLSALTSTTTMRVDTAPFRTPDTADGVVAQIGARLFGGEMPPSLRTNLLTYLRGGTYNDTRVRETLSLAMAAQEFQWY